MFEWFVNAIAGKFRGGRHGAHRHLFGPCKDMSCVCLHLPKILPLARAWLRRPYLTLCNVRELKRLARPIPNFDGVDLPALLRRTTNFEPALGVIVTFCDRLGYVFLNKAF